MAQNSLPHSSGTLLVLAGKCKAGLVAYQTPLALTQVTDASLQADITKLQDAVASFNAQRTARTAASKLLIAASAAARKFLGDARGLFVSFWGETYSLQWAQAGWTGSTTAVPHTQPGRLALVAAVEGYLAGHPAVQVDTPSLNVTATRARGVGAAFQGALDAVDAADTAAVQARDARAAADAVLRKDLRALISILNQKLTPDDARWAAFGLNAPGAAVTPHAPTRLQSHPALAGQIFLTCATPTGTDHFRWFVKGPADPDFKFREDTADAEWLATGLPGGQTMQVRVTAVNVAGESLPSQAVSVAVG